SLAGRLVGRHRLVAPTASHAADLAGDGRLRPLQPAADLCKGHPGFEPELDLDPVLKGQPSRRDLPQPRPNHATQWLDEQGDHTHRYPGLVDDLAIRLPLGEEADHLTALVRA